MDTHTTVDFVMSLLVLGGACFMLAAIFEERKAKRHIPEALAGRWRFMTKLMYFFFAGYLLFFVILVSRFTIPTELITAPVFLASAVFVFIVIKLTLETIRRIKEVEESLQVLNESLEQRVVVRTQDLEQSHKFLKTVLDSLNDEVMVIDVATNMIIGVNAMFLTRHNEREDAIIGRKCYEVTHNRQDICGPPDNNCPLLETAATGRHAVAEHVHYDADGRKEYVEVSSTPIRDADGSITRIIHVSRDITERKRAEEAVRQSEERYRRLVELSPDGISIHVDGKFVFMNPAGARLLGASLSDQLIGMSALDIVHPAFKEVVESRIKQLGTGTNMVPWLEEKYVRLDGKMIDVEVAGVHYSYQGKPAVQAIFRDITERKLAARRIEHLALYDTLTGLPNRTLFFDRMNQLLALATRNQYVLALLYVDLDRFKSINDTFGHEIGDLLLKEVSKRMTSCTRKSDTIARMGGDEFVCICGRIAAPQDAAVVAEKIIKALSKPFRLKGNECSIGASIGISLYPGDGDDAEILLNKADQAMYRIKKNGKGGCLSYTDS